LQQVTDNWQGRIERMKVDWRDRAVDWLEKARDFVAAVPSRWTELKDSVRRDPKLLLQSPAARGLLFGLAVAVCVLVFVGVVEQIAPEPPAGVWEASANGSFQVICSDSECGHRWTMVQQLDFDDWPVDCPNCEQTTGQRLLRCPGDACGRWVAAHVDLDGRRTCPHCQARW